MTAARKKPAAELRSARWFKQANEGCDFDFLETGFGAPVGEPSIY
jgi:hypothetical protein